MSTIPAGYGQITYSFSGSGVPTGAAVTLGFANAGPNDATTCCTAARLAFETDVMPVLVQNTGLDEVLVKLGPNSTGPSAVQASGVAGGDTLAQAPANVAYLVHKNTLVGGRRGRGRMYLPGVDETVVDQTGLIGGAAFTAISNAVENFFDTLVSVDMPPVILHEPETVWVLVNGRPRRTPVGAAPAPTLVESFSLAAIVATQRRRQRR